MNANYWFECTVSIDQVQNDGCTKKVAQKYLVDAFSFKEAEDKIIKEVSPYTSGSLDVDAVKKVRINDFFYGDGDVWYKVKTMLITIDEKTQAEKETPLFAMVLSSSVPEALKTFLKNMEGSLCDYRVVKVEETKILDVLKHSC